MHPLLENVLARPTSHKVFFWVFTIGFMIFVFWQYFYAEKVQEAEDLQAKIETLNADISHERRLARDLPKVREEVKQLDLKLKVVLRELPDKREIPDLLDSISNLARESGLEVHLFRPLPESFKEFYAEVPVSIIVEGTFHQIATFFDEVGRLSRIVNINQIGLRDPKVLEDRVLIKSDCLATTFRYLEESERIQASQENEGGKRRRR